MNLNIFKRVSELEKELDKLQTVVQMHIINREKEIEKKKQKTIERTIKRQAYQKQWYEKNKAKKSNGGQ